MPTFGKRSKQHLATLEPELRAVMNEAIKHYDFSIICGHRDMEAQNTAFNENKSQVRWPDSNHNSYPSRAVDCTPYPLDWDDIDEFHVMSTHIFAAAVKLGVRIRWGGHWKNFKDYPHFELIL